MFIKNGINKLYEKEIILIAFKIYHKYKDILIKINKFLIRQSLVFKYINNQFLLFFQNYKADMCRLQLKYVYTKFLSMAQDKHYKMSNIRRLVFPHSGFIFWHVFILSSPCSQGTDFFDAKSKKFLNIIYIFKATQFV